MSETVRSREYDQQGKKTRYLLITEGAENHEENLCLLHKDTLHRGETWKTKPAGKEDRPLRAFLQVLGKF